MAASFAQRHTQSGSVQRFRARSPSPLPPRPPSPLSGVKQYFNNKRCESNRRVTVVHKQQESPASRNQFVRGSDGRESAPHLHHHITTLRHASRLGRRGGRWIVSCLLSNTFSANACGAGVNTEGGNKIWLKARSLPPPLPRALYPHCRRVPGKENTGERDRNATPAIARAARKQRHNSVTHER